MKIVEIKTLKENVGGLLNYCKKNKIKCMHLNLNLIYNLEILAKEMEMVEKCIDPELIALEEKAHKLSEGKDIKDFKSSLALLSTEERDLYDKLYEEYKLLLQEERDITLIKIDESKLVQSIKTIETITEGEKKVTKDVFSIIPLEIELEETAILSFFFDSKNWEKKEKIPAKTEVRVEKLKKKKIN